MKIKYLFILFLLASCQEQKKNLIADVSSVEATEIPAVTDKRETEEKKLRTDTILFSMKGNRWKKKLLSAKDKPYFEKKMGFNEFHNQQ